jgi:hypothetical protein
MVAVVHGAHAAPAYALDPGVLNSAGSLQVNGEISNIGSVGQLGSIVSAGNAQAFGGFFHSHALPGAADTDGDGLSDAFDADNDNDGSTDIREILAGTDLDDAADVLRISGIEAGPDGVRITWPGKAGRVYRVLRYVRPGTGSASVQAEVTVGVFVASENVENQVLDPVGVRSGFYVIEVMP